MPNTSAAAATKKIVLCGLPASRISMHATIAGKTSTIETEQGSRDGYTYMLVYSRPEDSPADSAIENVMSGFCPGKNGQIAALPIPPNWKSSPANGFEQRGVWLGLQPMQMMVLMEGPKTASLQQALAAAKPPGQVTVAHSVLSISEQKRGSLCGRPALFVTMHMNVPSMPLDMHIAATQGTAGLYMLMYMHPSSEKADSSAMKSQQTLCAQSTP